MIEKERLNADEIKKLKEFLGEYLHLKGVNTRKLFRCFSKTHEDKHPSMSYYSKANICKCFACGEKYDIFKLVGQEYGIEEREQQMLKTKELYENKELIKNINIGIYSQKNTDIELDYSKFNEEKEEKKINPKYIVNYFFNSKKRIGDCNYLEKRGISKNVIEKYNIGYDPNFKIDDTYYKVVVFPTSYTSYSVRNIEENNEFKYRKVGEAHLFNLWELDMIENKNKAFWIVEGEIDALSVISVGKKAIALGSINNRSLLIKSIEEKQLKNKFYLMLDNDERGKKAQNELYKALKEKNIDVECCSIPYKDPNEFLIKNRNEFIKTLNNFELKKGGIVMTDFELSNKEDLVLLDIEDYNKKGLSVTFQNREYEIAENKFNPLGMSRLELLSKEGNIITNILYTPQRPVTNLYTKREVLEQFNLNDKENRENKIEKIKEQNIFKDIESIEDIKELKVTKRILEIVETIDSYELDIHFSDSLKEKRSTFKDLKDLEKEREELKKENPIGYQLGEKIAKELKKKSNLMNYDIKSIEKYNDYINKKIKIIEMKKNDNFNIKEGGITMSNNEKILGLINERIEKNAEKGVFYTSIDYKNIRETLGMEKEVFNQEMGNLLKTKKLFYVKEEGEKIYSDGSIKNEEIKRRYFTDEKKFIDFSKEFKEKEKINNDKNIETRNNEIKEKDEKVKSLSDNAQNVYNKLKEKMQEENKAFIKVNDLRKEINLDFNTMKDTIKELATEKAVYTRYITSIDKETGKENKHYIVTNSKKYFVMVSEKEEYKAKLKENLTENNKEEIEKEEKKENSKIPKKRKKAKENER